MPVRVLMDLRANVDYPLNADRLAELQTAGIRCDKRADRLHPPLEDDAVPRPERGRVQRRELQRQRLASRDRDPYVNYTDESIYFTDDTAIVNSFRTKFDDHWTDTTEWANYANVTEPLVRHYTDLPERSGAQLPAARELSNAIAERATRRRSRRST